MNCEEIESLMADALGDELSAADEPVFEAHLVECDRCRLEYESSRRAVSAMRTLPGSKRVTARREGDRLVIEDPQIAGSSLRGPAGLLQRMFSPTRGVFRYAASVLIAFTAGYVFHAGMMAKDAASRGESVVRHDNGASTASSDSLATTLAGVHARKPGRSGLAKCLVAMAPKGR